MKASRFLPLLAAMALAAPALQAVPPTPAVPSHLPGDSGLPGPVQRYTWSGAVVRIFQDRCQGCHHDGGISPFPLMTYRDAWTHRSAIGFSVLSGQMPPWHADSSCASYRNDLSLTKDEKRAIAGWAAAGFPEGDARDLPPPLSFPDGWQLGTPDSVLAMPVPFTPDFSKGDVYRCFVLNPNFTQDGFLSAIEVRPGAPSLVHHAQTFVDTGHEGAQLDAADPGPGYDCLTGAQSSSVDPVANWVPGQRATRLDDGLGLFVPKGADIILLIHYSPRGGPAVPDQTTLGLYFAHAPVAKRVVWNLAANMDFLLRAGDPASRVDTSFLVTRPVTLLGILPHMHLLGRTMRVDATLPDGKRACVVDVFDWDRRWQDLYLPNPPLSLPVGSRLDVSAVFDNSSGNPNNPNVPPQDVRWGYRTVDEMLLAYLYFILEDENLLAAPELARVRPEAFVRVPGPRGPGSVDR